MRSYETMVVVSGELGEGSAALMSRLEGVVRSEGGTYETTHDWGTRKLAYPIRRQADGRYYLMEYQAEPGTVQELERTMRITEGVLRFISVQQEHTGLPVERERIIERDRGGDRDRPGDRHRGERALSDFRTTGVTEKLAGGPARPRPPLVLTPAVTNPAAGAAPDPAPDDSPGEPVAEPTPEKEKSDG